MHPLVTTCTYTHNHLKHTQRYSSHNSTKNVCIPLITSYIASYILTHVSTKPLAIQVQSAVSTKCNTE